MNAERRALVGADQRGHWGVSKQAKQTNRQK